MSTEHAQEIEPKDIEMDLSQLILEKTPKDLRDFVDKETPGLAQKAQELSEALEKKSSEYIEMAAGFLSTSDEREAVKADVQRRWDIHVASVYKSLPQKLKDGNNFEKMGAALTFADDMMEGLDDFSYSMKEHYPQWAMLDKTLRAKEAAQLTGLYGVVLATVKGLSLVGKTLTKYGEGANKWIALIDAFAEVGRSVIKKVRRIIGAGATKSLRALYSGMDKDYKEGLEKLTHTLELVEDWKGATAAQKVKLLSHKASKLSPEVARILGKAININDPKEIQEIFKIVEGSKGKNMEILIAAKLAARSQGLSPEQTQLLISVVEEKDVARGLKRVSPEIMAELASSISTSLAEGMSQENRKAMIAIREVFDLARKADVSAVNDIVGEEVCKRFPGLQKPDADILVSALKEGDMSKGLKSITPAIMSKISESMTTSVEVKELFGAVQAAKGKGQELDSVIAGELGKRFLGLDSKKQEALKNALRKDNMSDGLRALTPDLLRELSAGMLNSAAFKEAHAKVQGPRSQFENLVDIASDVVDKRFKGLDEHKKRVLVSALQEENMDEGFKKLYNAAMEGVSAKIVESERVQNAKQSLTGTVKDVLKGLKHVQKEHEKMEAALFKSELIELKKEAQKTIKAGDAKGKADKGKEGQKESQPKAPKTKKLTRQNLNEIKKKSLADAARRVIATKLGIKKASSVERGASPAQ